MNVERDEIVTRSRSTDVGVRVIRTLEQERLARQAINEFIARHAGSA